MYHTNIVTDLQIVLTMKQYYRPYTTHPARIESARASAGKPLRCDNVRRGGAAGCARPSPGIDQGEQQSKQRRHDNE